MRRNDIFGIISLMDYHSLTKQITDLLTKNNYWFETFEHEPVFTSEEAVKTRPGYTLHQGAKAILAKIEKKNKEEFFVMFVVPGDLRLDSKKIKQILDIKSFRFATEEELMKVTNGLQRGALPPFAHFFNLSLYVDKRLLENEKIVFNAGDRRFSVAMKTKGYQELAHPQVIDIAMG
ncbi:hypothetical protein HY029_03855 [Candidatus Gottesmanbacteria bacterium]|nr:hypothetical protein [Candidatus Gottesmanbacteria bacterium]